MIVCIIRSKKIPTWYINCWRGAVRLANGGTELSLTSDLLTLNSLLCIHINKGACDQLAGALIRASSTNHYLQAIKSQASPSITHFFPIQELFFKKKIETFFTLYQTSSCLLKIDYRANVKAIFQLTLKFYPLSAFCAISIILLSSPLVIIPNWQFYHLSALALCRTLILYRPCRDLPAQVTYRGADDSRRITSDLRSSQARIHRTLSFFLPLTLD